MPSPDLPQPSRRPSEESCATIVNKKDSRQSSTATSARTSIDLKGEHLDVEPASVVDDAPLYSIFPIGQKRFIVAMGAMGAFFSAVSANIYFPALNPLARSFEVTPTLINYTLTGYQLCQAFAPLFIGDLADMAGRRPAYLVCFTIYIGANLGLAMCPSYAALVFFRCMQSSGSSGTISLGSGVVADVADSSQRGTWMSLTTAGSNVAPAIGPVIGGLLAQYLGWRSIFWFLTILASVYIVVFAIFFPETSRNVVGNGSISPHGWNRSLVYILKSWKAERLEKANGNPTTGSEPRKSNFRCPNPLNGLKLLKEKDLGLLLIFNAMLFSLYYFVLSTTPYLFEKKYNFDTLQIGFCYLPVGLMAMAASLCNGKIIDWNFRRIAAKIGMKVDKSRKMDLRDFPIEKARLQVIMPYMFATITCNFVYGWVMYMDKPPLAAALVLQACIGFANTAAFGGMNCFLVDLYPQSPSTATSANNFCRCLVAAGATAAVVPMVEAIDTGATFAIGAGALLMLTPISWVLVKNGPRWRAERADREAAKKEAERQRKERMEICTSGATSINENEKV